MRQHEDPEHTDAMWAAWLLHFRYIHSKWKTHWQLLGQVNASAKWPMHRLHTFRTKEPLSLSSRAQLLLPWLAVAASPPPTWRLHRSKSPLPDPPQAGALLRLILHTTEGATTAIRVAGDALHTHHVTACCGHLLLL